MPYGKYKGRLIADLPGQYLNWFAREGFPPGELGRLLALMQELDHNIHKCHNLADNPPSDWCLDQKATRMRSTRATAAVARLNSRSEGRHYMMALMSNGLFKLRERIEGGDKQLSEALSLEDFVRFVDSMEPQKERRITKNDAAFAKQLVKNETL